MERIVSLEQIVSYLSKSEEKYFIKGKSIILESPHKDISVCVNPNACFYEVEVSYHGYPILIHRIQYVSNISEVVDDVFSITEYKGMRNPDKYHYLDYNSLKCMLISLHFADNNINMPLICPGMLATTHNGKNFYIIPTDRNLAVVEPTGNPKESPTQVYDEVYKIYHEEHMHDVYNFIRAAIN